MEILGELIDLLQTEEIDLVILNVAPLTLRMKILENKKSSGRPNAFLETSF